MKKKITITPVRVADLLAEGKRMPVYVHVIDHPAARVLVDTGMTELHPAVADLDPRLRPLSQQDFNLAGIDIVVNTHLHFDHCGGNHLFAGKPIYVQRLELDDARSGMVDDVHIDRHPLALGEQVGNADWRDGDFLFHGSYFTNCSIESAAQRLNELLGLIGFSHFLSRR